jgi:hypothetical protein
MSLSERGCSESRKKAGSNVMGRQMQGKKKSSSAALPRYSRSDNVKE